MLATGATNGQIAAALVVSESTVKSHVKRILHKLPAANRAEAVYRFTQLCDERSRVREALGPGRGGRRGDAGAGGVAPP